ncbi:MAG: hypothetical protein KC422_15415 [Trueperaceae bacterium]|nr:hypothetical protein [Trueperaceae bacterium]
MVHEQAVYSYELVSPSAWKGNLDCIVGPFSSKEVAEYFAGHVVDFGQLESIEHTLFVKGDSWFLEIQALTT